MSSSLTDKLFALYGREEMKKETGLSRIRDALGVLIPALSQKTIVTIAGTNGKGETTLWLSRELGTRPHCVWISPHVERITERFRSEEGEISESELIKLVDECHELVQKNNFKLTYYEFLFLVFCHWASSRDCDYLLLEVGLGGRLDAVNVFDAKLVLLPSISRDHQEFLGYRYDLILREKLALVRKGSTLVSFLHLKYLRERTSEIVTPVGAKSIDLESLVHVPSWEFSLRNQLLARAAFLLLTGTKEVELPAGLKNYLSHADFLENRGEVLRERGEWIFYGSHNVDGMRNLIQFLQSGNYNFKRPPFDAVLVAFSRRESRDIKAMLKMLKGSGLGEILVTTFDHPKAALPEAMENLAGLEGIKFVHDLEAHIKSSSHHCHILVTGSYYFLGHIKSLLRSR